MKQNSKIDLNIKFLSPQEMKKDKNVGFFSFHVQWNKRSCANGKPFNVKTIT